MADLSLPQVAVAVLFGTCEPGATLYEQLIEPPAGTVRPVLPPPPQLIVAPGIESLTSTPVTATAPAFDTVIVPVTA